MPSFDAINYALRPSKSIQRQLVFEGIQKLHSQLSIEESAYVGLGSIWFTDFVLAHRLLGIQDMVSMESHEIGFARARFNAPYATVRVLQGTTSELLPSLYSDEAFAKCPWVVWLDYDQPFNDDSRSDLQSVIENAPANTILLVTFNGHEVNYSKNLLERPERLRQLFGQLVPDDLSKRACRGESMQNTLAGFAMDYMKSVAADTARPGGFVPAFRVVYRDGSPMVTVGGVLPDPGQASAVMKVVTSVGWKCMPERHIVAPHLTLREAVTLQAKLPNAKGLSRDVVRGLGFDLEDDQIEAFERYYLLYPSFAQILA